MDTEINQGAYHGKCLVTYSQKKNVGFMTQLAMLIRNPNVADSLMGLTVTYDDESGDESYRDCQLMLEEARSIATAAEVRMDV